MGLFDNIGAQLGGPLGSQLGAQFGPLAEMATKNPQVLAAVASLLSSKDASIGGTGGLGGLVTAFQNKGLGDMISSWIATGPNPAISAEQVTDVLGTGTLSQFAAKAGVSHNEAGGLLASLLPAVVDQLTPQGQLPATDALDSNLAGLLKGFGL